MRSVFPFPMVLGITLGVLAACAPQVPDSGGGSGYDAARAREQELAGGAASIDRLAPPQALSSEILPPAASAQSGITPAGTTPGSTVSANSGASADIANATAAALAASSTGSGQVQAGTIQPSAAPQAVSTASGLSAENDFSAVSGSRTIQDDAARIADNRAQYQVIAPTALPTRTDTAQPNIVSYALSTSHPRGTRVYSRSGINLNGRAERNCREFASADLAQIEFLSNGGPERDRASLDPDGDGFACSWDPAPFRRAVSN